MRPGHGKAERHGIGRCHDGKYPPDDKGKHAAIDLSHDEAAIWMLDQWNSQGCVKKRKIKANVAEGTIRSNDASWFCAIN